MQQFIGKKLTDVICELQQSGTLYQIVNNNHKLVGDTQLVTNAKLNNGIVLLTVSDFIFQLRNN